MTPTAYFKPTLDPWMLRLSYAFQKELGEELSRLPGIKWRHEWKARQVPRELVGQATTICQQFKRWPPAPTQPPPSLADLPHMPGDLTWRPYQADGLHRIRRDRAYMLAFDMGVGKTHPACAATLGLRTIVVCPAGIRQVWQDCVAVWGRATWTPWTREEAAQGPQAHPQGTDPVAVIGYELLPYLGPTQGWEAIVLDEAHHIKGGTNKADKGTLRYKACLALRDQNPNALRIALTGTPITDKPQDLWAPLDWLYPGRLGTKSKFNWRYCEITEDDNGHMKVGGANPARAAELRDRLADMCLRVTKADAAQWLPRATMQIDRLPSQIGKELDWEAIVTKGASSKAAYARNWVENVPGKCAVLTYLCDSAEQVAKLIGLRAVVVTGNEPVRKRLETIERAKLGHNTVIVASMKSIQEGIDLTAFPDVLYAELYWSPLVILQSMGRFHRMNSKFPVTYTFAVWANTVEERMAKFLSKKSKDIELLLGGNQEGELASIMSTSFTQADMEKVLQEVELYDPLEFLR